MKAIMIMFDSLNRRLLAPYGCGWTVTPNFSRLAERTVTFEKCFIGSMPCMPARREIHTGRYNFLHRSWGPLEPFDDSMPELLSKADIYTHLISDHYHYWEDGGATYHNRYSSWEFPRGQEGDQWKADVSVKGSPAAFNPEPYCKKSPHHRQDYVNRGYIRREEDMPQANTFRLGQEFIEKNHASDNWFLTIETFDPHEPFFSQPEWKKKYKHNYDALGIVLDWPKYGKADFPQEYLTQFRMQYAALLTMCDHYLGTIIDTMDRHDLWKDTMLIVNTDHGFLLGEHGWMAKNNPPLYNEIANTPFFVWDPRSGKKSVRNDRLVQTIDIAPTLLDYFGVPIPKDMEGKPLRSVIDKNEAIHDAVIFGYHGQHINVTDGRYVYMRAPDKIKSLNQYTVMPTNMRGFFRNDQLANAEMHDGFSFTKGARVMKIPAGPGGGEHGTLLFDNEKDPAQDTPMNDSAIEKRMTALLKDCMQKNDAPAELYDRFGLQERHI
ncbi:MAG: sulfatase [Spirochaetota bacterium]